VCVREYIFVHAFIYYLCKRSESEGERERRLRKYVWVTCPIYISHYINKEKGKESLLRKFVLQTYNYIHSLCIYDVYICITKTLWYILAL